MRESVEEENQALAELKNATLRNKNALQKENDKLSAQVESVSFLLFFCYDTKYCFLWTYKLSCMPLLKTTIYISLITKI